MTYPTEYLRGIEHFNRGEFFEAHEAWETIWLHSSGIEKQFYQGLIQGAAALLKSQQGAVAAAKRLEEAALKKLAGVPDIYLGLNVRLFEKQLKSHEIFRLHLAVS